jgi:hypothetical protein
MQGLKFDAAILRDLRNGKDARFKKIADESEGED